MKATVRKPRGCCPLSSDNPLIVQSDHTALLEVGSPLAEACRAGLARFAELEKSPEHVHTYRITPLSLWNARAASDSPPSSGHTCHWLYKNIIMDATGRIMPCCGGPRPDTNLVFTTFDGNGSDPFNSERYRQARAWFSADAHGSGDAPAPNDAPHCTRCEWDQTTVNVGGPEIRRYFRAADAAFFDRRSLGILSGW